MCMFLCNHPLNPPSLITPLCGTCICTCIYFPCILNCCHLSSCRYQKPQKRNSCVAQFQDGKFGEVKYFFVDKQLSATAVIEPLIPLSSLFTSSSLLPNFIVRGKRSEEVIITPAREILRKCVLVEIHDADELCTCRIPNFCETE